jgi:hypothetical protein
LWRFGGSSGSLGGAHCFIQRALTNEAIELSPRE